MKKIIPVAFIMLLSPILSQSQYTPELKTLEAHVGVGIANSFTATGYAGMFFNKHHGVRVEYFTQAKNTFTIFEGTYRIEDAFSSLGALYQYRINIGHNFDVQLAAGPAAVIPKYQEYYGPKPGLITHASINLWTSKQQPRWAGVGVWAGCGYITSTQLNRFFAEGGLSFRFSY